jgi:hypothetical protein
LRRRRLLLGACLIAAACLISSQVIPGVRGAESLPQSLTDQEFWTIATEFSEVEGYFRSDNLLSNERTFPSVLPELIAAAPAGRVYLGVGPEQNFNYIAVLKPKIAFIVDIRRGNRSLHLMYKALFELARDRADFVSRLFSRPRPAGLSAGSGPDEIFDGFLDMEPSDALYQENLKAITDTLVRGHGFKLSPGDLNSIEFVYGAFRQYGPNIRYSSSQSGGFGAFNQPSYADLMRAADKDGRPGSYLATESSFRVLKDLESKNMLVPVIGNFGGDKAIRAVGQYLRDHNAVVSAFYLSNVEMYLNQQNLWEAFCRNVSTLPLDEGSFFIRSERWGGYGRGIGLNLTLAPIADEVGACR